MKAKLQWLQDTSQIIADNLKNVRHVIINISETKRGNVRKVKLMNLNSKNNNIRDRNRGTHEIKKDYQPRTDLV